MQDKEFKLPRSIARFELRNLKKHPPNRRLMSMAVRCFDDATTEYFYPATIASLDFQLRVSQEGLVLELSGYSERQQTLLEGACTKLAAFKIHPKRLEVLREAYDRALENTCANEPHRKAQFYLSDVLAEEVRTQEECLTQRKDCTLENCEKFFKEFLSQASLEGLVYGNLRSEDAIKMSGAVRSILKFSEVSFEETENSRVHELIDGMIYEFNTFSEVHPNNAVITYYQVGSLDMKNVRPVVLNCLLGQILNEPCFNLLRTQEQLGYIVNGGTRRRQGTFGIYVLVQSDKHSSYLVGRIENFVNNYLKQYLAEMSSEAFEAHKEALKASTSEKPKNIRAKFDELWSEIDDRSYVFNRKQLEAAEIANLTKNDVIDFFEKHIANGGPALKQLIVKVNSKSHPGEAVESLKPDYTIDDVAKFKSTHSYIV